MELRVSAAILGVLFVVWASATTVAPQRLLSPATHDTTRLAELEDNFAKDPGNLVVAHELTSKYLEISRPGLAIAAVHSAAPELRKDPWLVHRLAQAYEARGRFDDAQATARLALLRCARSLGTSDAPSGTAIPEHDCSAREHAIMDLHQRALSHMVRWGVTSPTDSLRDAAYNIASRRASIAMVQ